MLSQLTERSIILSRFLVRSI